MKTKFKSPSHHPAIRSKETGKPTRNTRRRDKPTHAPGKCAHLLNSPTTSRCRSAWRTGYTALRGRRRRPGRRQFSGTKVRRTNRGQLTAAVTTALLYRGAKCGSTMAGGHTKNRRVLQARNRSESLVYKCRPAPRARGARQAGRAGQKNGVRKEEPVLFLEWVSVAGARAAAAAAAGGAGMPRAGREPRKCW